MHMDTWYPGSTTDESGNSHVFNCMCDLTQCVISCPVSNVQPHTIAKTFMEQVVLTFGICGILVVDDGRKLKSAVTSVAEALRIDTWTLSRGNRKDNSVERFHRFLNKTQTITANDRGTHHSFIMNAKTTQYAWNSSPIDSTDISRSMAAVKYEFCFPLDVVNFNLPPLSDGSSNQLA